MAEWEILETGAAALVFALMFLAGGHIHPLRPLIRDRRSIISFCAGMASAYVFVRVMPELQGARLAFTETVGVELRYEGMAIYFVALLGFLAFYGLDHLRRHVGGAVMAEEEDGEGGGKAYRLHIGGFAAYVALMTYVLVHGIEEDPVPIGLYALAVAVHFLTVDHEFREEHGEAYLKTGRFLLAGMAVAGWGLGLLVALPHHMVALLVAFLAGGIMMNSLILELPGDKDGRFLPFVAGGILYGLVLLPLG